MIYREYGRTGKKVSVIGFGGMRFRKEDYGEKAALVVRKASELGINYFDTAPLYCDDKSEEIFGLAFQDMPRQFYISTKSMISHEPDADAVRKRLDKSLQRLGVEKIDFFHMWNILNLEQYRQVIAPGGPYQGARQAQEEGLVDHIVFSTHCDGEEIETIVQEGYFEGMTVGYNAINFPFREKGLQAAAKMGLGIATMNPLGGGLIPQNPDYFKFLQEFGDETVVQAALRFNASHQEISTVLAGMGSIEEVLENVQVGAEIRPMSEQKMAQIKSQLSEAMNQLCTGCGYCKGCPVDIPIPKYLDAYNMYILQKNTQGITDRLKWHWRLPAEKAGECIECRICEAKCTQKLPIIERLKMIAEKC